MSCAHTTEKAFRGNVESKRCVLLQTDVPVAEHQDQSMEHKTHRKHQQSCHALTETSNLCRKSTHRRLPSKPLIERCSLFHGPPLPGSTSTQARTVLLLQLCNCQLRSYLNIPPSLPTVVTFKTCTFAAIHRQPTSFDPQPPRFNVDGDQFRQICSHLTTRGPLIFQRPFSNLQNTLDIAVLDLSSRSTGA